VIGCGTSTRLSFLLHSTSTRLIPIYQELLSAIPPGVPVLSSSVPDPTTTPPVLLDASILFEISQDQPVSSPIRQSVVIAVIDGPLDEPLQTPSIPFTPSPDATSAESPDAPSPDNASILSRRPSYGWRDPVGDHPFHGHNTADISGRINVLCEEWTRYESSLESQQSLRHLVGQLLDFAHANRIRGRMQRAVELLYDALRKANNPALAVRLELVSALYNLGCQARALEGNQYGFEPRRRSSYLGRRAKCTAPSPQVISMPSHRCCSNSISKLHSKRAGRCFKPCSVRISMGHAASHK
jgi:hypothetical protein